MLVPLTVILNISQLVGRDVTEHGQGAIGIPIIVVVNINVTQQGGIDHEGILVDRVKG